jgi:CubicO group peptidase (beta-lactamase class C family)
MFIVSNLSNEIKGIIQDRMDAGEIAGGIALVARHGEVEVLEALGTDDADRDFALKTDTIFHVMSMSKPVATASASILVAEGKLSLDSPLSEYIPEFAKPRQVRVLKPGSSLPPFPPRPGQAPGPMPEFDLVPAQRAITVRDLMSMTTGLQTLGVPDPNYPPITPEDTLATWVPKLADLPLDFQPGARWHYSNTTSYDVVGRLVEIVSGKSFGEFVRERFTAPLGMSDTQFGRDPNKDSRSLPLGMFAGLPVVSGHYHSGSGGLFSTASDYAKFAQLLLNKGKHGGEQLIPAAAIEMMSRNQIGDLIFGGLNPMQYAGLGSHSAPGLRFGYGVGIVTDSAATGLALPNGSYGWDGIGTRRFWVVPELDTVIVMLVPGIAVGDNTHRAIEAAVCK